MTDGRRNRERKIMPSLQLMILTVLLLTLLAPAAWLALLLVLFVCRRFPLWLEAKAAGLNVSFLDLVMIYLKKLSPEAIVGCLKVMRKAGLDVSIADLESHQLAGGHLDRLQDASIAVNKAGLNLTFRDMAAIDLAGRDIREAVDSHVNPKVLICPPQTRGSQGHNAITAVARDGIRLAVRAKVTVRTRIDRLVGAAGEATIIARVDEGIVAAIGRAESHRDILAQPEIISQAILDHGLDSATCFEIISVDIADVDVQDNVAARLQTVKAEADKRIARAKAEERRAAAIATQQEMQSRTVGMQVKVTEARAELPLAVATACQDQNLGNPQPFQHLLPSPRRWQSKPQPI